MSYREPAEPLPDHEPIGLPIPFVWWSSYCSCPYCGASSSEPVHPLQRWVPTGHALPHKRVALVRRSRPCQCRRCGRYYGTIARSDTNWFRRELHSGTLAFYMPAVLTLLTEEEVKAGR